MPEIKRGELAVESAELGIRQAQAGFYPSVTLTAGIGTGHMSNGGYESGSQVWNRFNENVGLTLSIPIFSNRKNRTAVNKARLEAENSRLSWQDLQKTLPATWSRPIWTPSRHNRSIGPPRRRSVTPGRVSISRRSKVQPRGEEHRRADHGPERVVVGPPGGPPGEVHDAAEHRAAEHLPGRDTTTIN